MTDTENTKERRPNSREQANRFMTDRLNARLNWELRGPKDTMIEWLQSWSMMSDERRIVMVQVYKDGHGFDVFPQVLLNGIAETAAVVEGMSILEEDPDPIAIQSELEAEDRALASASKK